MTTLFVPRTAAAFLLAAALVVAPLAVGSASAAPLSPGNIAVGQVPWGVAVDSNTHTVYVANLGSNSISVINDGVVTGTINDYTNPQSIAVDSVTHAVYVAYVYSNVVAVIDGTTNVVTKHMYVGDRPSSVAVDSVTHTAYVANAGGTVSVINGLAVTDTGRDRGRPRNTCGVCR